MSKKIGMFIGVVLLISMVVTFGSQAESGWVLYNVEEVTTDQTYIKVFGSGQMANVVINNKYYMETTRENGKFSVKIPRQKLGTEIEVYVSGDGAARSISAFIKTQLQKATAKRVKAKAKKITGTGYAGSKVKIYKGKRLLGKATCNKKGKYTAKIAKPNLLKKGVKLKLISTAKAKGEKYTSEAVVKVK